MDEDKRIVKFVGQTTEEKRLVKIVAQAKEKEFNRLRDYALNQMSLIEVGLNPQSVGRHPYGDSDYIYTPTLMDIMKLNIILLELHENILTFNERGALNE